MNNDPKQVCGEFLRVMYSIKATLGSFAEKHGLTLQQAMVLYTLHNDGIMLMGAVAERLHCDASNVTGMIDRLVAQGFVTRQESKQDRRAKYLTLTRKGKRFIAKVTTSLPRLAGFETLTDEERVQLLAYLKKLGSR